MEYQHYGSRGATTTDKKEVDESCTVGTVLVSERRKPVVTNNEGCATATLTTFPSTSPGTTAVPRSPLLVNTVGGNQTEAVAAPATPATPVEPSSLEHTVVNTSSSDTSSATGRFESTRVAPATPATQISNLLSDVGTTQPRSAVVDMVTPAVLTATPATLAATPTVEVAVAAPATPEMLTTTPQTLISVEPTIADPATPAMPVMPATLPAMLPPAMPPEILRNTISHLHTTLAPDINHPDTDPPQEPFTVLVPIKDEPSNDDQTLSSNDVTKEVPPTTQEHEVTAPPYKLRQREPVNYRKLHMGVITQATTNLLTNRDDTIPND
ncbi:hypothetical protein GE061_009909 [Apolygus lucorum]|uniref:Uncharacterized protein n=1 Tax=Apolygus lucorum TaxID=248454 RepID=A0A8S9Y3L7_APOLU|nr:hypothetical protein GE061_009909 [Apolygus lucorum]